jgi:hypothetical protein
MGENGRRRNVVVSWTAELEPDPQQAQRLLTDVAALLEREGIDASALRTSDIPTASRSTLPTARPSKRPL